MGEEIQAERARAGAVVAALEECTRFSLRLAAAEALELKRAAGFDLQGAINSVALSGVLASARLGPDEWLLLSPAEQGDSLRSALEAELESRFFSLVDVSHRSVAFAVTGARAADVLNAGVALDLDDSVFTPGMATRTLLGKAEVVLMRADAGNAYRVECWRSFGPYVQSFLDEAAREFAQI